jgi:regulator of replication initiation timing
MVEKKLIALGLICVVLSVGFIGTVMLLNQKDIEMQIKTDQISGLENDKLALQTQVSSLQTETTSLNNEKSTLETQVSSLQTETTTLNNEKTALATQVSSLQTEITSLEDEVIESFDLGYAEGESEGYQLGYDEGYVQGVEDGAGSGWYIRDPTYDEAIAFINSDKTDENEYTADYVCYDFTADFDSNAFQMGYRCGFVYIEFTDSAHAIVCFNTTDMGLIYIEPQNDKIVTIAIGQTYLGDTIVDLGIIW